MTPEHKFTLWSAIVTGLPTVFFTGVVAFWTWRRDQERIVVQKSPVYWKSYDGNDGPLAGAGIVVTNHSLYPVRISGIAFRLDGKTIFIFDREKHAEEWPAELASRSRMKVYADEREWKRLQSLGVAERIMDWSFVAVALTETGKRFSSDRVTVRVGNLLRTIRSHFAEGFERD